MALPTASASAVPAASHPLAVAPAGRWHHPHSLVGIVALSGGRGGELDAISCAAPGFCGGVGHYLSDLAGTTQAFVDTEVRGVWGTATAAPGVAHLPTLHGMWLNSISCAAPGDCTAGGTLDVTATRGVAVVLSESAGRWGSASLVPGTATLAGPTGSDGTVSVSCRAPGSCAAVGSYSPKANVNEVWVDDQRGGAWHQAVEAPGLAALNAGQDAVSGPVSCAAVGDCSTVGGYLDAHGATLPFVVSEADGSWHRAIEVPDVAALHGELEASLTEVSCAAAGDCTAIGSWEGPDYFEYSPFAVTETNGTWGRATPLSGAATGTESTEVTSISCAAPGACSAGGGVAEGPFASAAFVVDQVRGVWQSATLVDGLRDGQVDAISCAAVGDCTAVGFYWYPQRSLPVGWTSPVGAEVSEEDGVWGHASPVPDVWASYLVTVSCAAPNSCSAGGMYLDGTARYQPLTRDQTPR